tara:strand:- start:1084 stop:2919 length:1836 start_codon:yes stop_codon:yes gene_type:complete
MPSSISPEPTPVHTGPLSRQLHTLITCEHRATEKPRELALSLDIAAGQVQAVSATGDIGTVHWTAFDAMGLPSDDYALSVAATVDGEPAGLALSYTTLDNVVHQHPNSTLPFSRDIKLVHLSLPDSTPLASFDTYEIDGATHWLHSTTPIVRSLESRLDDLFDGSDLHLRAWDDGRIISWKGLENQLNDLQNKLSRVQLLKERIVDRYAASPDEGWFAVFGDVRNIDLARSSLHIVAADAFRQTDLVDGNKAVMNVEQCLQHSKSTRIADPIADIVHSLYTASAHEMTPKELKRACDRHVKTFSQLLAMRGEIVDTLRERRSLGSPKHDKPSSRDAWLREASTASSKAHAAVVENRAHYLALAAVDAGLRAQTSALLGLPDPTSLGLTQTQIDIRLLHYQLRQMFANNRWNEIQLSELGFQRALDTVNSVLQLTAPTNNPLSAPVLTDVFPFELQRRVAYNRIIESLARVHGGAPDIGHAANFIYASRSCLGSRASAAHLTRCPLLRRMLHSMIVADRQNRIITPLVYSFIHKVVLSPETASAQDINTTITLFTAELQPFVRMALTGHPADDPFRFLHGTEITTGYDDSSRTSLLIQLMFNHGKNSTTVDF